VLADFIRWYSPGDWEDASSVQVSELGLNSPPGTNGTGSSSVSSSVSSSGSSIGNSRSDRIDDGIDDGLDEDGDTADANGAAIGVGMGTALDAVRMVWPGHGQLSARIQSSVQSNDGVGTGAAALQDGAVAWVKLWQQAAVSPQCAMKQKPLFDSFAGTTSTVVPIGHTCTLTFVISSILV
jgi:hypothetical protein